ncbi:unnamed protein product [Linum trigynum]|uniref:Uncharacterized protein n=1 Tax=Linum trigynum TaxID=586398 RepID=A0AAV2EYQ5_9ROSI
MATPSTPDDRRPAAGSSSKRLTLGILMSISSLMALCAKHAGKFSTKLSKTNTNINIPGCHRQQRRSQKLKFEPNRQPPHGLYYSSDNDDGGVLRSPRSPLVRHSKQLLTQISNKAVTLVHGGSRNNNNKDRRGGDVAAPDEFGDGGVWQRSILMGDKCQPLDFSGVIYYDSCGKKVNEVPVRSPRASPLPRYLTRGH